MRRRAIVALFACLALASPSPQVPAQATSIQLYLPLKPNSVRFALIGDSGTGEAPQYEIARQMTIYRKEFPFDFVLMLGDNIYGSKSPDDLKRKFDKPYQDLLNAGVAFYPALGNHDSSEELFYKPFHLEGKRFYQFAKGNVEFFALDSNRVDRPQQEWLRSALSSSTADWKICYMHHPLYSFARFHEPSPSLRGKLEPVFQRYGVNAVFAGHDHVYENIKEQQGIRYFVLGSSGQLRYKDLMTSPQIEQGFDVDQAFMMVEIVGDELYFQVVSRTGITVDKGVFTRKGATPHEP